MEVAPSWVTISDPGEVSEWLKEHAWKACVPKRYRGFESLPLRQIADVSKALKNERAVTASNLPMPGKEHEGSHRALAKRGRQATASSRR